MNIQITQKRIGNLGNRGKHQNDENFEEDDIDPDLRNEVEIHFTTREYQSSAKSRQTGSRKSDRKSEIENSLPSARIVKSRGRPIKPHETEPFLSIDNLPADRTFLSERSDAASSRNLALEFQTMSNTNLPSLYSHTVEKFEISDLRSREFILSKQQEVSAASSRPPTYRNGTRTKSPNEPQMTPYVSPRQQSSKGVQKESSKTAPVPDLKPSQSARPRSNLGSRSASRQGLRSRQGSRPASRTHVSRASARSPMMTAGKHLTTPNHHVKSPFKHSVFKPRLVPEGRHSPSQELKARTTQAAFYINRLMAMTTDKDPPRTAGKLKKGRLKPLYPVNVEGPSIDRCRGIISEARSYEASPSRTLQRRIHLMNTIPNVHEYLLEHRPCTTESVHQTSVADSDDEVANMKDVVNDETVDSIRSIPDRDPYMDENLSLTANGINNIKGTDVESRGSSITDSPTPRMFATELGTKSPQAVEGDLTVPPQLVQFSETQDPYQLSHPQIESNGQDDSEMVPSQDNAEPIPEFGNEAQKVRSTSPSKSVRFVDKSGQSVTDIRQQSSTSIAKDQNERLGSSEEKKKDQKKNKQSLESCKSDDLNAKHKKDDDDDDDDDKDKDKNIQNQNQSQPGIVVRGGSGKTNENKSENSKSGGNQTGSQKEKTASRNMRPRSHSPLLGQNCSKFRNSSASKPHKNKLQVQTINHADATPTIIGPESPSRSRNCSRSGSPTGKRFTENDSYCISAETALDKYDYFSERTKVKFMIEGEEPEIETIFVEDEDDIGLRHDKDITFEAIESELKSLRHSIQNKLFEQGSDKLELYNEMDIDDNKTEGSADTNARNGDEPLFVEGRNPSRQGKEPIVQASQDDYTDLIEKYRKRCMDRSELYGAFSERLITPRSQSSYANSNRRLFQQRLNSLKNDASVDSDQKSKLLLFDSSSVTGTHISDSGHGSMDNVSELSRPASVTSSGIPRLNLEQCTSDLDLDSGSEASPKPKDGDNEAVLADKNAKDGGNGTIVAENEFGMDKNILEMVCDDLPPVEPRKDLNRKEMEEDVSNLSVVATTKCLLKQPQEKMVMPKSSSIPFPPLCFTINARPPSGYLYYFAYGPDMNPSRFSSYIKREVEDRFWALLFGFNLVFNKKGTSIEAGGFANLEFNPLRSVEGCLYKITPQELAVLDKCVGYPEHYEHLVLPVWFSNSRDPDQYGVCQYCVPALTFIAQNQWTETETKLPCDYALSQCIKSADMCTQEYRDSLVNLTYQIEAAA